MATERKRRREDFDVSEIKLPCENATIHRIVAAISPVKTRKSNEQMQYFNAKLSDGVISLIKLRLLLPASHHLRILPTCCMRWQVFRKGIIFLLGMRLRL